MVKSTEELKLPASLCFNKFVPYHKDRLASKPNSGLHINLLRYIPTLTYGVESLTKQLQTAETRYFRRMFNKSSNGSIKNKNITAAGRVRSSNAMVLAQLSNGG